MNVKLVIRRVYLLAPFEHVLISRTCATPHTRPSELFSPPKTIFRMFKIVLNSFLFVARLGNPYFSGWGDMSVITNSRTSSKWTYVKAKRVHLKTCLWLWPCILLSVSLQEMSIYLKDSSTLLLA